MKIELKIDGRKVELDQKANIAVTHSIADVQEPDNTSAGYSKSVEVPLTPANMHVFRFTNELYSKEQFNNELHTAEFVVDGNTVMSGIAQIDKITCHYDAGRRLAGGSFHVSVIGAAFEWITSAKRRLDELEGGEEMVYNMQNVYNNSVNTGVLPVKFFPVDRGAFYENWTGGSLQPRTSLNLLDYHPFINIWETLKLIFKNHTIHTSMRSYFEKLYCSGQFPDKSNDPDLEEICDFKCGGEYEPSSNVFPNKPFDCFSTFEGEDYFANNVLKKHHTDFDCWEPYDYTCYVPPQDIAVRFEAKLTFECLLYDPPGGEGPVRFIDTFCFGTRPMNVDKTYDNMIHFRVEDSVEYREDAFVLLKYKSLDPGSYLIRLHGASLTQYTDMKIGFEGHEPMSLGDPNKRQVWQMVRFIFAGRVNTLTFTRRDGMQIDAATIPGLKIEMVPSSYRLSFNLTHVTDPIRCSPTNGYMFPCKFIRSWDTSVLKRDVIMGICSLRPVFGSYIAQGDKVTIATVGGTNTQLDFIAAVRQMFNLMFYTNPLTKEVFIEPRTRFYNLERSDIVDWRGKIDYAKEIEIEELGADIGKTLKLAYADGNEVVEYYNWKSRKNLGAYSTPLLNKTNDDTKEIINPIFAPFLVNPVWSVNMIIPQEKREKTQDTIDDLSITPIIGYFTRIQRRSFGSDRDRYSYYPRLEFQDEIWGVNLGFEDSGLMLVPGLNQYYRDNISAYNVGRRITMHLKLEPQDVEAILYPTDQKRDFRAVFLLTLDGEEVPCLLESVEDYNPAGGASTRCVFISDPNIRLTGDGLTVVTHGDTAVSRDNTLIGYR